MGDCVVKEENWSVKQVVCLRPSSCIQVQLLHAIVLAMRPATNKVQGTLDVNAGLKR